MVKQAQTIELSTDLGINYIPCCKIVLMQANGYAYAVVAEYKERNYQTVNNIRYEKRK